MTKEAPHPYLAMTEEEILARKQNTDPAAPFYDAWLGIRPDERPLKFNPRYRVHVWTVQAAKDSCIKYLTRDMFTDEELVKLKKKLDYYSYRHQATEEIREEGIMQTYVAFLERLAAKEENPKDVVIPWFINSIDTKGNVGTPIQQAENWLHLRIWDYIRRVREAEAKEIEFMARYRSLAH